jgi:acyl-CoA synthetase (AMP-forming)/AMP-acid ligase II
MRPMTRRPAWRSMVDLLRDRADRQPDERAYTFLEHGERESAMLTWGELERRSRAVAADVQARVPRGARVLVLCPPSVHVVPAFFGSLFAGTIAVLSYPPRATRQDRSLERLDRVAHDAAISLVLAPRSVVARAERLTDAIPALGACEWVSLDDVADARADDWSPPHAAGTSVAFLQYTSGSTRAPRGVMVTHGSLLHNLGYADALAGHGADSASVSWLPVNHDMGLIQGVLQAAFSGFPAWLMAPAAFLQRPVRWLNAISRVRATLSGAPNFAYDLCVRRVTAEEQSGLDLASWRLAFNGAEPVRDATLEAFADTFAGAGFRSSAFRPAYGLAESTLLVSAGSGPTVSCGQPACGIRVEIVDPRTRVACPSGAEGEIWVAGESVAAGYWNRPDETEQVFHARMEGGHAGRFLRTGDLGVMREGGLVVTGRIKDVLIVRGAKHHPHDLETTAESALIRWGPARCAVFGFPEHGEEGVGVAVEIDRAEGAPLFAAIREAIAEAHGIQVSAIALVAPGTLPKTTSGKLQRYACREGLLAGALRVRTLWRAAARGNTPLTEVA